MQGNRAAVRYAKAILSLAKEKGLTKEVHEDMGLIKKTIDQSRDLRSFLKSPVVKGHMKKNALQEIFKNVSGITSGIIDVLVQNNRLEILWLVAGRYRDLYNELNGIQIARVVTAVPLTPELETRIQEKVKQLTGSTAKIQNIIDRSIIGGFILRVGDIQYNGSVSTQLTNLKRELKNNTYVSKI